jgi:type II secretory pathway component PulF
MRLFSRLPTLFVVTSFALLSTLGGCTRIGEAIDCEQMCKQLRTCVDGDLNVDRCSERCEDKTETSAMRNQLDDCTDCLDQGYSCAEMSKECPACKDVSAALL